MKALCKQLVASALVVTLCSCASISVKPGSERKAPEKPKKIYVSLFSVGKDVLRVDREGTELAEFKSNLQLAMQTALVTYFSKSLFPAEASVKGHEFEPEEGWLVRGEFTKVNQGSRLLRGTIGLGAGGTKMETKVYVYDLSSSSGLPIMTFSTTGGSGAEPGAFTSFAPNGIEIALEVGLAVIPGVSHGVSEDTKRTAREITDQLSDYLYKRGWITKAQWHQPKPLSK